MIDPSCDAKFLDYREITRNSVENADILFVRSVTCVDEHLLDGTCVKFVATPTSGVDHIDHTYLQSAGIRLINTPGCNARSVAEYVISCLYVLRAEGLINLKDITLGIIGCGHVGSSLASMLEAVEIRHLLYDPPLEEAGDGRNYSSLREIQDADIISLHVPLTSAGKSPTFHLLDEEFLSGLKPDVVIINTARGEVIDEKALLEFLGLNKECNVVLDVSEKEPVLNPELLSKVKIFTPHIAGYSLDAKYKGTRQAYEKICDMAGLQQSRMEPDSIAGVEEYNIIIPELLDDDEVIQFAVLSGYDVRADAERFKRLITVQEKYPGQNFSNYRREYPVRREFTYFSTILSASRLKCKQQLEGLGFKVNLAN